MTSRYAEILTEKLLRRLYEKQGLTLQEMCVELQVNQRTVTKFMDKYGIERRPQGMRKQGIEARARRIAWVRKRRAEGWTYTEIGEELGVTRQRAEQMASAGEG